MIRGYVLIIVSFLIVPQNLFGFLTIHEGIVFAWVEVAIPQIRPEITFILYPFLSILFFPPFPSPAWEVYRDPFLSTYILSLHFIALSALLGIAFHRLGRAIWFSKFRLGITILLVMAMVTLTIFNYFYIGLGRGGYPSLSWMFWASPFPLPPTNFLLDGMLYGCYKLWAGHPKK